MLVDDKQAREKTAADDLRWLIAYSNDSKLSNQRLEEIASLIESLSAQVEALTERLRDISGHATSNFSDAVDWRERAEAAEAQVAELKRDADGIRRNLVMYLLPMYRTDPAGIAKLCDEVLDRSGRLLGEVRDAAKESGVSP